MKTIKTLLLLMLFAIVVLTTSSYSYNLGLNSAQDEAVIFTQNSIADRYLKHIGNPATLQEHCLFIEVVYGDYLECNN